MASQSRVVPQTAWLCEEGTRTSNLKIQASLLCAHGRSTMNIQGRICPSWQPALLTASPVIVPAVSCRACASAQIFQDTTSGQLKRDWQRHRTLLSHCYNETRQESACRWYSGCTVGAGVSCTFGPRLVFHLSMLSSYHICFPSRLAAIPPFQCWPENQPWPSPDTWQLALHQPQA